MTQTWDPGPWGPGQKTQGWGMGPGAWGPGAWGPGALGQGLVPSSRENSTETLSCFYNSANKQAPSGSPGSLQISWAEPNTPRGASPEK